MRCDEVIFRLSDPDGASEDGAVSEHLARCERCAAWAARNSRFERLWEATRPGEVSHERWERVWHAVSSTLEQSPTTGGGLGSRSGLFSTGTHVPPERDVPARPRRWRSAAVIGMFAVAQAAALLLAVGIAWRNPNPSIGVKRPVDLSPPAVASQSQPILESEFDFDDGQVPLIRADGSTVQMIDLAELDSANGEDPWFVFFNRVEAASTVVAMAE